MGLWDVFEGAPFALPANLVPLAPDMLNVSLGKLPAFASASLPEMGGFDLANGKSKQVIFTPKGIYKWSAKHQKKDKEEQAALLKKALDSVLVDDADIGSLIEENEAADISKAIEEEVNTDALDDEED